MGKSKNGPDWVDVGAMLQALQALHGCTCSVELMLDGSTAVYGVTIKILSTWQSTTPGRRNPMLLTEHGTMPVDGCAAAARVYGALHEHDAAISERLYKQSLLEA